MTDTLLSFHSIETSQTLRDHANIPVSLILPVNQLSFLPRETEVQHKCFIVVVLLNSLYLEVLLLDMICFLLKLGT